MTAMLFMNFSVVQPSDTTPATFEDEVDCWGDFDRGGDHEDTVCDVIVTSELHNCKYVTDLSWWDDLSTCDPLN